MWNPVQCVWVSRLTVWTALVMAAMVVEVLTLNGPNVCMVKQKYNITKRIKYRAPMSIRTYQWCLNIPPRCSHWSTEMRDLTRLETEERVAEVSVCCPGYKMKDVSCVPICPNGKTGPNCADDCGPNRWGPNCVHECKACSEYGSCSPVTGECICQGGWQGERCEIVITTSTTSTTPKEELLTTSKAITKTTSTSTVIPLTITEVTTALTTALTTRTVKSTTKVLSGTTPKTEPITSPKAQLESTPTAEITKFKFPLSSKANITSTLLDNSVTLKTTSKTELNDFNIINNSTKETSTSTYSTIITSTEKPLKTSTAKVELNGSAVIESTRSELYSRTKLYSEVTTTPKEESTRRPEITTKVYSTTVKFKPKEIWIKPAQKGDSPIIIETKSKAIHELSTKYKNAAKIDIIPNTTPKTIIVSIIPTSVSYASFKKIALSTASYMNHKNSSILRSNSRVTEGFTKSMFAQTSTSTPSIGPTSNGTSKSVVLATTSISTNISKSKPHSTLLALRGPSLVKSLFVNNITNSMSSTTAVMTTLNSSNSLTATTISFTNITTNSPRRHTNSIMTEKTTLASNTTRLTRISLTEPSTKIKTGATSRTVDVPMRNVTTIKPTLESTRDQISNNTVTNIKVNVTNISVPTNMVTTNQPVEDEEKSHILTEPEHITAVMSENETATSSLNLSSVISIVGGVMMAIITVAVIIVMMERCRRPRYDAVRKINDMRMQVIIDGNDVPPPYVRSIFHTPLPEPPNSEKCHYQPISTLDRNLKQFMRPVVVQTISPIMLENFRGILECHYDHLPRRNHDFSTLPASRTAPSINNVNQHLLQRASLTESAIEALKCEAKLDVIDSTTSEPLYAEIPCWRPPSEHAVEIMNVNGEAVTEL